MIDEKKKDAAVARILAKVSNAAKEAFHLKCDVRTIERAVAKARLQAGSAPPPPRPAPPPGAPPPSVAPPNAAPPGTGGENKALSLVLKAAGGEDAAPPPPNQAPPPPPKSSTPEEDAKKRDVEFALGQMRELKETATGVSALVLRIPITDSRVEEAAELSWFAENSVENNAAQVAEWFRQATKGGPWLLVLILIADVVATALVMWDLREEFRDKRAAELAKKVPVVVKDSPSQEKRS